MPNNDDDDVLLGTVENHGKKWQKSRHTFVKIAKVMAKSRQFIQLLILQNLSFPTPEKYIFYVKYILR